MPADGMSDPQKPARADAQAAIDTPVGESGVFRHVLDKIRRYAPHDDVPVVFEGETGTGKSILARYLHSLSPRARRPYLEIDLGTLDEGTLTSELFGHTKGAFTGAVADARGLFAHAHGGAVFLDELQYASRATQLRLLRIVDTGELRPIGASRGLHVDVRIITATNVPIARLLSERDFLPDLAARLLVAPIRVPPLREHRSDIPLLVERFLEELWPKSGYSNAPRLHPALVSALQLAPWPENIRGLAFTIRRLLIESSPAPVIGLEHCQDDLAHLRTATIRGRRPTPAEAEQLVREFGNVSQAARHLQVSRTTMYRYLDGSAGDARDDENGVVDGPSAV
jgi:DNA-binding NtrC family response regulator